MNQFEKNKIQKEKRLGLERYNNDGDLMKVIEYNTYKNIVVEFQDEYKERRRCSWKEFEKGSVINPALFKLRFGEERLNKQGCLMRIVVYNKATDIIVEFQDKYKGRVHTQYGNFITGNVYNPYLPNVFGIGITGNKYPIKINGKHVKEYATWSSMLQRCYDIEFKKKCPAYDGCKVSPEWLLYENFYEWLHSQPNFDKWLNGERWCLDKDIISKGNKIYSSDTCCLVPNNVNVLFTNRRNHRGNLPIGVKKNNNKFVAECCNPFSGKREKLENCNTPEESFFTYKIHKESIIRQVAEIEYTKGNITEKCYNSMLSYKVEITD